MNKKKAITVVLVGILLAGCSTGERSIQYKNLFLQVPEDMTVSYNEFDPFEGENVDINSTYIGSLMAHCASTDFERNIDRNGENPYLYYPKLLEEFRDSGLNSEIKQNINSLTCNSAGGSIAVESIEVAGLQGAIFTFQLGNSGLPSLSQFFKQVLIVGPENQAYSVVFNYDFGELSKYLSSIKSEYGEAILDEEESYKWEEVYDYLAYGTPIQSVDVKGFEENDEVIMDIIQSIKIN